MAAPSQVTIDAKYTHNTTESIESPTQLTIDATHTHTHTQNITDTEEKINY